jgi:hypothetical protein
VSRHDWLRSWRSHRGRLRRRKNKIGLCGRLPLRHAFRPNQGVRPQFAIPKQHAQFEFTDGLALLAVPKVEPLVANGNGCGRFRRRRECERRHGERRRDSASARVAEGGGFNQLRTTRRAVTGLAHDGT